MCAPLPSPLGDEAGSIPSHADIGQGGVDAARPTRHPTRIHKRRRSHIVACQIRHRCARRQTAGSFTPRHAYTLYFITFHTQTLHRQTHKTNNPEIQNFRNLTKNIHQNTFRHLTYLVLNKRKLDNKQTRVPPPYQIGITSTSPEPTS